MLSIRKTVAACFAQEPMTTPRLIARLALLAWLAVPGAAQAAGQPDLSDDCYGPTKPLTAELRAAFVAEIRPLAANAERDHGIPAPMFAAMAIHESGYGTTRLAIAANNLLSYKWPGAPGPDGRAVYELTCQPEQDKGRIYVAFRDHADAIDFVSSRLAASRYYGAATKKYQSDLAAGEDRKDAAIAWFRAIAPTYNPYHTVDYVQTVLALADDPISRSGHVEPAVTLWTLAPPQTSDRATAQAGDSASGVGDPERAALASVIAQHFRTSRYMMPDGGCKPAAEDPELAANTIVRPYLDAVAANPSSGARVVACTYSYEEVKHGQQRQGFGLFLDLPPPLIAGWIASACRAAVPGNVHACGLALIDNMNGDNGGQYPITGFVAEGGPTDQLCKQRGQSVLRQGLIGFRYGVTVQFAETAGRGPPPILYCTTDPIPIDVQRHVSLAEKTTDVYGAGRVAGLKYGCWSSQFPRTKPEGLVPDPWQRIVHESMLAALKGGTDALFNRAAWLYANHTQRPDNCGLFAR
jgi:hypothetical protein